MKTARPVPDRHLPRIHWTRRRGDFMTPLPPRRARHARFGPDVDWEPWREVTGYGHVRGVLRDIAVLVLCLLAVLSLILLFAEFWSY